MAPSELQSATNEELIAELMSRATFAGLVVWAEGFENKRAGHYPVRWRYHNLTAPANDLQAVVDQIRERAG